MAFAAARIVKEINELLDKTEQLAMDKNAAGSDSPPKTQRTGLAMANMSEQEAFEEAKRRWGKNAHVRYRQGQIPQGEKPYAVGQWVGHDFRMRGQGESWEEAFENADRLGKP